MGAARSRKLLKLSLCDLTSSPCNLVLTVNKVIDYFYLVMTVSKSRHWLLVVLETYFVLRRRMSLEFSGGRKPI